MVKVILTLLASAALLYASWVGWIPSPFTEMLAFVTGAICVYLCVIENIWNFPIGIANSIAFFVLFAKGRLFGDATLQLFYIGFNIHGWYWWLRGGVQHGERQISRVTAGQVAVVTGIVIGSTAAFTPLLRHFHDPAPVLDSFTTSVSLAAQYLMNWKFLENWYVWIAVDLVYIYLYVIRGYELSAFLYFILMCMCVVGLVQWRRAMAPVVA